MIHCKIDWFTGIVHDSTVSEVFKCLGFEMPKIIADIENSRANDLSYQMLKKEDRGYMRYYVFSYNGIRFKIQAFEYEAEIKRKTQFSEFDYFNFPCDLILEIGGSGLDFLRSIKIDIDSLVQDEFLFGSYFDPSVSDEKLPKFKLTRIDVAFDFVNCFELDFPQCYSELMHCKMFKAAYIPCSGSTAASKYSIKTGSTEETIYLGSVNSERLLRIYNKLLERTVKDKKFDFKTLYFSDLEIKNDPDFNLKSWYRVEYQLRRNPAQAALYGCGGDLTRIGRELCKRYCLCYPNVPGMPHMKPIKCFHNIFDYEGLTRVGLNNHFSIPGQFKDANKKLDEWINRNFSNWILSRCRFPDRREENKFINKRIYSLYNSVDPADRHRYNSLRRKFGEFMVCNAMASLEETGVFIHDKNGCIQITDFEHVSDAELDNYLVKLKLDSVINNNEYLKKCLEWYQLLFDQYCLMSGGFSWNKQLQEAVEVTVNEFDGFDPRLNRSVISIE